MPKIVWTPEMRQRLDDKLAAGKNIRMAAAELGVSEQAIYNLRHEQRKRGEVIKRPKRVAPKGTREWTPTEDALLTQMFRDGRAHLDIATTLEREVSGVRRRIIGLGLELVGRDGAAAAIAERTRQTKTRQCLRCREPFESEGAHHRFCDHCQRVNARMDRGIKEHRQI